LAIAPTALKPTNTTAKTTDNFAPRLVIGPIVAMIGS
jgi:hypothetical protein